MISLPSAEVGFFQRYKPVLRVLPVVLWMVWIFSASTDAFAPRQTSRFIQPLLHWLFPGATPGFYETAHFAIRKGGHVAEYAILAWLFLLATGGRRLWLVLLLSLLYAMSDEWHQSFVPSRQGAVADVVIDMVGATLAVLIWLAWQRFRRQRRGDMV